MSLDEVGNSGLVGAKGAKGRDFDGGGEVAEAREGNVFQGVFVVIRKHFGVFLNW